MDSRLIFVILGLTIVSSGCINDEQTQYTAAEQKFDSYLNSVIEDDKEKLNSQIHRSSPLRNNTNELGFENEAEVILIEEVSFVEAVEKQKDRNVSKDEPLVQKYRSSHKQLENELGLDDTTTIYFEIKWKDSKERGIVNMVREDNEWYVWGV